MSLSLEPLSATLKGLITSVSLMEISFTQPQSRRFNTSENTKSGLFKADLLFLKETFGGISKNGIAYPSSKTFKTQGLAPISHQNSMFFDSLYLTFGEDPLEGRKKN